MSFELLSVVVPEGGVSPGVTPVLGQVVVTDGDGVQWVYRVAAGEVRRFKVWFEYSWPVRSGSPLSVFRLEGRYPSYEVVEA